MAKSETLRKRSRSSILDGAYGWGMTLPSCRNETLLSLRSRISHATLLGEVGEREQVHIQQRGY
jgi:hypothetical protein